ncbi:MAG: hypothetical protein WBK28_02420 [Minisyncoccia bacterium]
MTKQRFAHNLALFEKWGEPEVWATAGSLWRIDRVGTVFYGKGLSWRWQRSRSRGGPGQGGVVRNPFVVYELNALVSMRAPCELKAEETRDVA